jgi:hypothetical protein
VRSRDEVAERDQEESEEHEREALEVAIGPDHPHALDDAAERRERQEHERDATIDWRQQTIELHTQHEVTGGADKR